MENNRQIDFYWDIGSTNSYFAFHLLRPLARQYDARINYVPLNLGFVFRHHNYVLMDEPVAKMRNRKRDLQRWAQRHNLAFAVPETFPIKTSRALRGALVMRQYDLEEAYMADLFRRYWEEGDASIVEYEGLAETATRLGVSAQEFIDQADSAAVRELLVEATRSALDSGVFGAPTMVIGDEIYWGKDRFEFIEDHLKCL